jgi:MtrB/PioB family decaheme-associated outer membrane protein
MRKEMQNQLWTICAVLLLALGAGNAAPVQAEDQGFRLGVDAITFEGIETDVDTDSAKFQEYRDLSSGFNLTHLRVRGEDDKGERFLWIRADNVNRDDARYGLEYGVAGRYSLLVDYNKIPHRFGNNGTILWNRTGPGSWEISDSVQAQLQGAVIQQFPGVNSNFLAGLIAPHLAAADSIDLGLQRDRTRIQFDLGKMGQLAWAAEVRHENRQGLRPYGGTFGFNNATEIPEPIDYSTTDSEIRGEWNGDQGGVRFGYRYSMFKNDISTLTWDNPWVGVDGTSPVAYLGPNNSPFSGSRGFADLAPDNEANLIFASGRARLGGGWWVNGTVNYNVMTQNDPLLPYTLNTAIQGVDPHTGATFNAADINTLPVRNADTEVKTLSFAGTAGTKFGDDWKLTFRYRYYDYDNASPRIEFPGYVRTHAVWEAIPRVTVPYQYTKNDLGAELAWDVSKTTTVALSYRLLSWDREFREVHSSDEDIVKLTFDTKPTQKVAVRASWENGSRDIKGYETEAQEASFLEPEGINNQPGLRKFSQAARDYDDYDFAVQLFPSEKWNVTFGLSGRDEKFPESDFGLVSDEILQVNFEIAYTPGADFNVYLFGHRADRDVFQRARQSGGTLSTSPLDDWSAALNEKLDTWGLGINGKRDEWTWDITGRWSNSDGEADFETPPGGSPSSAVDFGNYEDIELLGLNLKLDYQFHPNATVGFWYLYEDYVIDSFILAGLQSYLPGSLQLAANAGDYTANVFGLRLQLGF